MTETFNKLLETHFPLLPPPPAVSGAMHSPVWADKIDVQLGLGSEFHMLLRRETYFRTHSSYVALKEMAAHSSILAWKMP